MVSSHHENKKKTEHATIVTRSVKILWIGYFYRARNSVYNAKDDKSLVHPSDWVPSNSWPFPNMKYRVIEKDGRDLKQL